MFSGLNIKSKEQTLLDVSTLSIADFDFNIDKIKLKLATVDINGLDLLLRNKTTPFYHLGQLIISNIAYDNQVKQVAIDNVELNENSIVLGVDAKGRFKPPEINLESNEADEQGRENTDESPKLNVKLGSFKINNTTLALLNSFDVETQVEFLSVNEVELITTEYDLTQNSLAMGCCFHC